MTKRIRVSVAALVVGLVLAISCGAWAGALIHEETITVCYRAGLRIVVDGREVSPDVKPFIAGQGWIMVPVEFMSKELGAAVAWDDGTSTFTITTGRPAVSVPKDVKGVAAQNGSSVVAVAALDSAGRVKARGSGVVVGENMIITNLHVIAGAASVYVTSAKGHSWPCPATLWEDETADLALLWYGGYLPPVRFGDSNKVEIGEGVVAIGSPLGLQGTVSEGIISGFFPLGGRRYLLTTAAISPGSSGGGLFTMDGALIGITTAMFEGGQNLNLAIPAWDVELLVDCYPRYLTVFPGGG